MRIFLYIGMFLLSGWAFAADVNGYTAKYECISGGANCDVDVATLTAQACQQTITTSTTPITSWAAVNWTNTVICIEAGDHTGRGTMTLGSSGTSGTRKILRYYRSGDTDDDPWDQSSKAILRTLDSGGRDYWIIHRLSFTETGSDSRIYVHGGSNNLIFNRLLVSGFNDYGGAVRANGETDGWIDSIVFQNSVVRSFPSSATITPSGLRWANGDNLWIVNNEIYDVGKSVEVWNTTTVGQNFVVENNDMYLTSAYYTNCSGGAGTECSKAENLFTTKSNANSTYYAKIIQNRFWGGRPSDPTVCCDGGGTSGPMVDLGGGDDTADYFLVQNNIIMDGMGGVALVTGSWVGGGGPEGTADQNSIIGNIFYNLQSYDSGVDGAISVYNETRKQSNNEFYLNTFVSAKNTYGWFGLGGTGMNTNFDARCNVVVDSANIGGAAGTGTIFDYNVFYGTTKYTVGGGDNNLGNYALNTRANSTAYSLNDIIRTSAAPTTDCTSSTDSDCFLYKVTTAGTSAGSNPGYCTTLGCSTTDGTMVVKAIRGPYSFYRKLRTGAEQVFIPYVRGLSNSTLPEYDFCPSGFASRSGIGVDNTQP